MDKLEPISSHHSEVDKESVPPPLKTSKTGLILVPQPTDDPQDPLNWSSRKKITTLAIVSLASFAATLQTVANQAGFFPQAELYHKTPVQLSYSISAAIAGLAAGPFIWNVIAKRFGKCGPIAWGMILALCMNIWSASMTKSTQYNAFVVSRLFAAIAGSAPTTVGANMILETFFLHDRGKCFSIYTSMILLGTVAASTFSGFIIEHGSWTIQFWYNVGFEGFICICCVLFLDETAYPRGVNSDQPRLPEQYLQRKLATYACIGKRITPHRSRSELFRLGVTPFLIGLSPVGLLIGFFLFVMFSWSVAVSTDLSVYLQNPVEEGGYGFTPYQNAYFSFAQWVGVLASQVYGHFINDRLPLWICSRRGGTWKPEYRLNTLWFPSLIILPASLGLLGASLYYHLHYMVLALAVCLQVYASVIGVASCTSYVVECFTGQANEVAVILSLYRTAFGLAVPFFIFPWSAAVGTNWAFGMMAFFTIFAFGATVILMIWGPLIRARSLITASTEDGVAVTGEQLGDKNEL
ncbi:major facilitator superfamily domain-containing protein [Xylogone sp. PMI_703]|nr:major facilitator superfamily domain-containing protein [Xylogone sp. PMI_703]